MAIMDWAAWCLILGLSFISIGGLLVWAYGDSMGVRKTGIAHMGDLPRSAHFNGLLIYGIVLMVLGLGCLFQGTILLSHAG
jgi:hypothetical protein